MNNIKVRDVMKTNFDMVDGMATIKEALDEMQHVETKCLIVKKRDEHDEIGMLLISDIARKVIAANRSINRVNVYEVMSKPVIAVDPDMQIQYCARLFGQFHISRAPVLEHDEIIGVVSLTDLVLKGLYARESSISGDV
jgi:predicted transcriptional regulator